VLEREQLPLSAPVLIRFDSWALPFWRTGVNLSLGKFGAAPAVIGLDFAGLDRESRAFIVGSTEAGKAAGKADYQSFFIDLMVAGVLIWKCPPL